MLEVVWELKAGLPLQAGPLRPARRQTSETIDRNKATGRPQSRTSIRVSDH